MAVSRVAVKVPAALIQPTRQVSSSSRQMAAQAAVAKSEPKTIESEPLKVSSLANGLTVASVDENSPVTTLGVVVKAGSSNESYDNAGASHVLRVVSGMTTQTNSSFGICRNLQQLGASLTCTQGREHTLYTVQVTRDQTDVAAEYLLDCVGGQAFKPWELERNVGKIKLDLAQRTPATQAVELLHQAAFRSGLGNSLYCPAHKVGSHSTATLQEFVSKHFTAGRAALVGSHSTATLQEFVSKHFKAGRAALVGIGVSHSALTKYSGLLSLDSGSGPVSAPAVYHGAELRCETGGGLTYVALAGDCAGATAGVDSVAAMLLQRVLGSGSHVKYGGGQGKLAQAVAAATSANCAVSALGQMYTDAGLLGALIVSEAGAAGKVVGAVASTIRNITVTEEEVAAAKNNFLMDCYRLLESPASQIETYGSQALIAGDVMPVEKIPELVAGVTVADVQAAAKKLSSSKLSLGAVGNLSTVPYVDSL